MCHKKLKVKSMPRTETKFLVRGEKLKVRRVKTNLKNSEKGVSLYLAVVVLAILLAISLGLSSLIVTKIKIVRGMEESVIALYAADTGIEKALTQKMDPGGLNGYTENLNLNGQSASYVIDVRQGGIGGCPVNRSFCIKSIGTYQNTSRAIEIEY